MPTMHYFWMKFDCSTTGSTGSGASKALTSSLASGKEVEGGTVRSSGGGSGGSTQGVGNEILGGTVRSGGGGSGGSTQGVGNEVLGGTVRPASGGSGGSVQGAGNELSARVVRGGRDSEPTRIPMGGTVRSRAEADAPLPGVVSFNLITKNIVGKGDVKFYCIDGQTALHFASEALAIQESQESRFQKWALDGVAVLTCIETP